jgi:hypothetical protein
MDGETKACELLLELLFATGLGMLIDGELKAWDPLFGVLAIGLGIFMDGDAKACDALFELALSIGLGMLFIDC